jgi:hypothetical protein
VAKNPVTDPPPIYPTDQPNDRLIKSFDSDFNRRLLKSEPFTKFVFRGGTNVSIDEEESSSRCSFFYKDCWNSFQVWPTWTVGAKYSVTDPPPIYPTERPNLFPIAGDESLFYSSLNLNVYRR